MMYSSVLRNFDDDIEIKANPEVLADEYATSTEENNLDLALQDCIMVLDHM